MILRWDSLDRVDPGQRLQFYVTLGIWSTGDLYLTEEAMARSEQRVQGRWRYERFNGSHWVPVDQPDRLNRLLVDFLS